MSADPETCPECGVPGGHRFECSAPAAVELSGVDALEVAQTVYQRGPRVAARRCHRCASPAFPMGCLLPVDHEEREHVLVLEPGDAYRERWLEWAELGDVLKLALTVQAQAYIDAIAPPLLEQVERARGLAVELEHKVDWLTPTYQRADGENDHQRLQLRGYLIGYPHG